MQIIMLCYMSCTARRDNYRLPSIYMQRSMLCYMSCTGTGARATEPSSSFEEADSAPRLSTVSSGGSRGNSRVTSSADRRGDTCAQRGDVSGRGVASSACQRVWPSHIELRTEGWAWPALCAASGASGERAGKASGTRTYACPSSRPSTAGATATAGDGGIGVVLPTVTTLADVTGRGDGSDVSRDKVGDHRFDV